MIAHTTYQDYPDEEEYVTHKNDAGWDLIHIVQVTLSKEGAAVDRGGGCGGYGGGGGGGGCVL